VFEVEHSISISGLKIRYLNKGTGSPIVLLHGFSFNADTWVDVGLFDELAGNYSVYSFDMPYGPKSRSDKFSTENRNEYAGFLNNMLKTLNIHNPALLGASISGEVTLRYLINGYSTQAGIVIGPVGIKSLGAQLCSISIPLLAIWGEKDTISPPVDSKILASHVKDSEVHIIEGASHPCYLDQPGKFKDMVRDFLHRKSREATVYNHKKRNI
jgi:abhydrolase domain-containing protein 14